MHFHSFTSIFTVLAFYLTSASAAPTAEVNTHSSPIKRIVAEYDYTDVNCATECYYGGAGTGPNEGDCVHVVDLFWNLGARPYYVSPNTVDRSAVYGSCVVALHNPSSAGMIYQDNLTGTVADYIRSHCNAANNAHGGKCTFSTNVYPAPYTEVVHT